MDKCKYCNNHVTRNVHNLHKDPPNDVEQVCEIHYAYLKPTFARVNPINVGRCMRCGQKSTNKDGTKERLIDHHVNYPLDITVPVCDSCHQQIHSNEPDQRYLERSERGNEPYTPVGTPNELGLGIHKDYRDNRGADRECVECGAPLIRPPKEMGIDGWVCPNSDCRVTDLSLMEINKAELLHGK